MDLWFFPCIVGLIGVFFLLYTDSDFSSPDKPLSTPNSSPFKNLGIFFIVIALVEMMLIISTQLASLGVLGV